jgi:hypothetical protein
MIASAQSSTRAPGNIGEEPYFAIELTQPAVPQPVETLDHRLQGFERDIGLEPVGVDVTENFAARDRPNTTIGRSKKREGGMLAELWGRLAGLCRATGSGEPAKIDALEERAIGVLEGLMPKTIGQAEAVFGTWFDDLEQRVSNKGSINAMEYLTILHVLKERLFEKSPQLAPYVERMERTLIAMRPRLAGDELKTDAELTTRLPRRYLAKQSRDVQAIHAAVFRPTEHSPGSALSNLAGNYLPQKHDAAIAAAVLALCFHHSGVELLAGAVHGYLIGTFIEHAIHKQIGHASKKTLEKIENVLSKFGPIGRSIYQSISDTAFSHGTIHHASYAGDYVDRFAPREKDQPQEIIEQKRAQKKEKLDAMIEARGPKAAKGIHDSDYGRSLAHAFKDALTFMPVSALVTLGTALIANLAGADVGILFATVSIATSLLFIPASKDLHPYLHMPREEALAKAGPIMRQILKSRYVAHVAQSHHMHHRDAAMNQNLVPGADFALGYKTSPVEAVLALRKMKTFY